MAKTDPGEEEIPMGRKTRLSQRQEGGGQVRGRNLEVRPEAEGLGPGGSGQGQWAGLGGARQPSLWLILQE